MAEQKTYTRLSMASTAIGYTARCLRWLRRVRRRSGLFHPVRSDSSDSAASGHIAGQGDARYRGRRIVRCRPCTRPYFYSTRRVHRGPARERLAPATSRPVSYGEQHLLARTLLLPSLAVLPLPSQALPCATLHTHCTHLFVRNCRLSQTEFDRLPPH